VLALMGKKLSKFAQHGLTTTKKSET
jgi:hypothetical protein